MKDYNKFAKTFSKSRKGLKWPELDYFIEIIKKEQKYKEPLILDIGCGSGRLIDYLDNSIDKYRYLGIDSSAGMIDEAKNTYPNKEFSVLDMIKSDILDTKFDIVFFVASFHHLNCSRYRSQALKKLKLLTNKESIIFMTNWNLLGEANFSKYKESYLGDGDFHIKIGENSRYYHSFDLDELRNLIENAGFDILENKIFGNQNNIISIFRPNN